MKHLNPLNEKARRLDRALTEATRPAHEKATRAAVGDEAARAAGGGSAAMAAHDKAARAAVHDEAARAAVHDEAARAADENDVVALCQQPPQQPPAPHIPLGCSTIFSPGWEVDRTGGTAGLCQPVERDLFDCHLGCFWPAQVPDQLNHAPDWTKKCAAAQKDWRKIDVIFP